MVTCCSYSYSIKYPLISVFFMSRTHHLIKLTQPNQCLVDHSNLRGSSLNHQALKKIRKTELKVKSLDVWTKNDMNETCTFYIINFTLKKLFILWQTLQGDVGLGKFIFHTLVASQHPKMNSPISISVFSLVFSTKGKRAFRTGRASGELQLCLFLLEFIADVVIS